MEPLTLEEIKEKIEPPAKEIFEKAGVDLIELKVAGRKNDVFIQITADKPSGGITIRECAILNKTLAAAIEQEHLLPPEIFSLELSSPGLDRPLVTRKDFIRSINRKVHFWLSEPVSTGGKKEMQGVLVEVGDKGLIVNVLGSRLVLPLSSIIKGMLVI